MLSLERIFLYYITLKGALYKMSFDKWFEKQSRLIQIILLLIPVVGWVVEVLVRLSSVLREAKLSSILGLIFGIIIPFFSWLDLIWVLLFKKLLLQ